MKQRSRSGWSLPAAACLVLVLAVPRAAGAPAPQEKEAQELEKRIGELVAQLGADDPAAREQAVRKLIEIGAPVLKSVREAANSPDVEVRERAGIVAGVVSARLFRGGEGCLKLRRLWQEIPSRASAIPREDSSKDDQTGAVEPHLKDSGISARFARALGLLFSERYMFIKYEKLPRGAWRDEEEYGRYQVKVKFEDRMRALERMRKAGKTDEAGFREVKAEIAKLLPNLCFRRLHGKDPDLIVKDLGEPEREVLLETLLVLNGFTPEGGLIVDKPESTEK